MALLSRRTLLRKASLACGGGMLMRSNPLGLPVGLELYTVSAELNRDLAGTLERIAQIGYQVVEWPRFATDAGPQALRRALDAAGLRCPSVHYTMLELQAGFEKALEAAKTLGAHYVICSAPMPRDPARLKLAEKTGLALFLDSVNHVTLDDWRWNANQLNRYGEQANKAGLQFGYHNHNVEFKRFDDVTPYDLLLRSTDPKLVVFEMDCGWVTVAGRSPAAYMEKYPGRVQLLHIKDFRAGFKPTIMQGEGTATPTELGRGSIDYGPIFAAAKASGVQAYFVEQEPPFLDMPALEAIKADYEYLHKLDG